MLRRVAMLMAKQVAPPVYATWNPSDKDAGIGLTNGNLTATYTNTSTGLIRSTISKTTGIWYWETHIDARDDANARIELGLADSSLAIATSGQIGGTTDSQAYLSQGLSTYNNAVTNISP